ncbi:TrkA family potassium uptake protein [Actinomyces sp. zg-332]|uniref:potassium channel family protein n=1 Tax=Actinomyces sp. zg-332 TaxID=2708340 RepID=UPI00141E1695|nr:TrkA family potassium uptake protein [Actinomyces sp. zg-332]
MKVPNNVVDSTLVIGLGRFGSAVAVTLDNLNREILAVDISSKLVQKWSSRIPTLEADMTNMAALEQIGAADFSSAVVGVGSSLEASVLITANLVDIGVSQIWAKATSREHGRILKRIGAHHVIYPEFDAGQRTAHLVSGRMLDYIEMERNGFSIVKMRPPREFWGFTLEEAQVRRKYGVTVIGVLSVGQPFEYASASTRIHEDDIIIVGGDADLLEQFAYNS